MKIESRNAIPDEKARRYIGLSFFEIRRRWAARLEVSAGVVEEVSFTVKRAWKQFTCDGPPCCPNAWFLETDDSFYVQVDSWQELGQTKDEAFPGEQVVVVRWPRTMRVLSATVSGPPVASVQPSPEAFVDLANHYVQCLIHRREDLPEPIRRVTAA